jgi:hypothetical protein
MPVNCILPIGFLAIHVDYIDLGRRCPWAGKRLADDRLVYL